MAGAYDIDDRLIAFAADVCTACSRISRTPAGKHAASQLTRSATSPFANYGEARGAESRRDFIHKMRLVLKELRESKAWLRFVSRSGLAAAGAMDSLLRECDQLIAIFVASIRTAERNDPSARPRS